MENQAREMYRDYRIADIPEEDLQKITDLENKICKDTNEDIVLIAYKHCQDK